MNVCEIPRSQWPAYFDQFSRTHRAWLATIDSGVASPDYIETVAHPLRSITPFVHNNRVVHIDIRFQDDAPGRDPVRIHAPVSVRVEETTEGIAQGLEIVDDKSSPTRLRFHASPRPELLDGVAPGEALSLISDPTCEGRVEWRQFMASPRSVPKTEWWSFFDRMSQAMLGKWADIEVAAMHLGDNIIAEWVPMLGITYDSRDDLLDLALDPANHVIRHPKEIIVEEDATGLKSVAVLDSEGARQIVNLKMPLMLPPPAPAHP